MWFKKKDKVIAKLHTNEWVIGTVKNIQNRKYKIGDLEYDSNRSIQRSNVIEIYDDSRFSLVN